MVREREKEREGREGRDFLPGINRNNITVIFTLKGLFLYSFSPFKKIMLFFFFSFCNVS